ncbi:uncharacterized protein F4812DRAFT_423714 [Daldinia caldariorum]|uniref:uncharacterized protein n=1 Tax=Daldinia caldariorum TaxID=326644 RepID=UPI002008B66A|nr:uncharacterized protein F4812DRAFT_423714 [Daldinia caldariorum]KAI1469575.1 hypothetical protein F4812DRAFT_423714 [Daldinia caldariorum]
METINNVTSAAVRAVWGESKQNGTEPISGQTGNTSKGEPYDAGNIEDPNVQAARAENSNAQTNGHTNGETNYGPTPTEHTRDAEFAKETGTAAEAKDTPDNPSTDLKSKSTPDDTTKAQNDTRSPEDPKTNPKSAPTDVNDAEGDGPGPNEAQKLDGPGPKPLDEVAREHGGDAGKIEKDESKPLPGEESASKSSGSTGAGEDEDEDGPNAKSTGEGTGEKYVKSSGLKADGGDFDATNPGAGREADRLLEEKGIHPGGANGSKDGTDASGHKEKKSIGQKIKDKMHRH